MALYRRAYHGDQLGALETEAYAYERDGRRTPEAEAFVRAAWHWPDPVEHHAWTRDHVYMLMWMLVGLAYWAWLIWSLATGH